jgi:hypothetical protein
MGSLSRALAWQRDVWASMGMTEAAIDRNFSPGGLPYYRTMHACGLLSDDEMKAIELLWPGWQGDRRDIPKLVAQLLA